MTTTTKEATRTFRYKRCAERIGEDRFFREGEFLHRASCRGDIAEVLEVLPETLIRERLSGLTRGTREYNNVLLSLERRWSIPLWASPPHTEIPCDASLFKVAKVRGKYIELEVATLNE